MTRYKEDLERILGIGRDSAKPNDLEESGGIPSSRGIGSQNSNGSITGFSGSSDDTAEDDNSGEEDSTTDTDYDSSSKPDANNPDSLIKGRTDGIYDADDLIDGVTGPTTIENQGIFEGGNVDSALSGINATDCDTGKSLTIRTDGLFTPPEATYFDDGTTPKTSEWTDPDTPPTIPGYESGYYWRCDSGSNLEYPTPYSLELFNDVMDDLSYGSPFSGSGGPGTIYYNSGLGNYYELTSYDQISETKWSATVTQTNSGGTPIASPFTAFSMDRNSCPGTDPDACPVSPPVETAWPSDDTISLSYQDGKFVTNQYDDDATPQYEGQNRSSIPFCMDGGRYGIIRAGKNGGTVIYETDSVNGAPVSNAIIRYYAADGTVAGFGDNASLDGWLPPTS